MHKRILAIGLVTLFITMSVLPTFAGTSDQVVITYGETTYANQQYKSLVDDFFAGKIDVNLNDVESKVITAGDVNAISSGFSGKSYNNSNQIVSCALLDLNQNGEITVDVDNSITTITPKMYMSALKTAGIQGGHVYVTSPVSATGESALTGIMDCYEVATDVEIPENVKEAANQEISTEAEILNNSNVSADDLSNLVDDVKEKVNDENITDHAQIVNIINDYSTNYNINISDSDIENLAETIQQIQMAQDDANAYKDQSSDFVDSSVSNISNGSDLGFSLDGLFNTLFSIFNGQH